MNGDRPSENTAWLGDWLKAEGVSLFGTADVRPLHHLFLLSAQEIGKLDYAVSFGIRLSRSVLEGLVDGPTLLYKWHYQQANQFLDRLAFALTQQLTDRRFNALPIPASQIVDWENHRAHLSHRAVGEAAGLGWRGRNNLLVHPQWGSQFRLVTVLTDMPLEADQPMENRCGDCMKCVRACPVNALGFSSAEYNLDRCHALLSRFSKERGIGVHICGLCVKACNGDRTSS
jgi:epoxyqueuosine reductase